MEEVGVNDEPLWMKDTKPAISLDELADRFDDPNESADQCRRAIRNWTWRMLHGEKFPKVGGVGAEWRSFEDALGAWLDALKYWEQRAAERKDEHDR